MPADLTMNTTVVRKTSHTVEANLDDDIVITDVDASNYVLLNNSAAWLWRKLEHPVSVARLAQALQDEFDVDEATCTSTLLLFLDDLHRRGLLTVNAPQSDV